MKFCDCGNILMPIVTTADAYFECTVCRKRHEFTEGDTLIKPPAVKPSGIDKVAHIIRHLKYKSLFTTVGDKPCPMCGYQWAKVLIDTEVWYGCMAEKCGHVYQ
jgi:DNA-directed RNA polymerase subunit M/transcription elongation factor TFIIS